MVHMQLPRHFLFVRGILLDFELGSEAVQFYTKNKLMMHGRDKG